MSKLILTLGIQGSGKTFWSKKWAEEQPLNRIRLNYDDIRNMLGKYWVPEREDIVLKIFKEGLYAAMDAKKDIIIDNFSNLNPKHQKEYEEIVEQYNNSADSDNIYQIEYKLFDTPLEVCLERDAQRDIPIGEKVIKQCWKKYRNYIIQQSIKNMLDKQIQQKPELPRAIVVDMDATLCFNTNGRPFYGEGAAEGMLKDIPNDPIVDLVSNYGELGYNIIILTGRDESCRDSTEKWLEDMGIFPDEVIMRPDKNYSSGPEVKEMLYNNYVKDKYYIEFVIDDSTKCVEMWRDLGLTCLQPNEGKF